MSLQWTALKPIDPVINPSGFDLNGDTASYVKWDVRPLATVTVQAVAVTTWATATFAIERSLDGFNWFALESADTLGPASDISTTIDCTGFAFLRARLSVAEGSQKFAIITAFGKADA